MPFSGYQDLDPAFARSLQALVAANAGISPFSGYRSIERQRQLWEASDKSGKMVAAPGRSQHNFGRAVDLRYADDAARAFAHANAARYGLNFPMSYEPWHVEPIGARSQPHAAPAAMAEPQASQHGQAPGLPPMMPAPQENAGISSYMQGIFGIAQGGGSDWMENRSYSGDAILGDMLAGHSPLRRLLYQKVMGLFA